MIKSTINNVFIQYICFIVQINIYNLIYVLYLVASKSTFSSKYPNLWVYGNIGLYLNCCKYCQCSIFYSTNCDQLTPWLHSTESYCLHSDAVKHSLILWENRDILRHLHPFTAMFWHNGPPLLCCTKLKINCDIMHPCLLLCPRHAGDSLVLI